jgi:hypothetical protein
MLTKIGWLLLSVCFFAAAPARAQVVVNEIMYRPGTGYPENTGREFIELHNPTASAVDLSGWAFTAGIGFTFPAGTTMAAGGFVVVAANPALVQSTYGISDVFGPWAVGKTLANSGEKITLSKPGAVAGTFEKINSVTYASEGDWATRIIETTFNGWDWSTPANGTNKSMELRNPMLSNDNGQNWAPSTAAAGATPGAGNSVLTANVPPIIHGVTHSPAVPKSTQSVTISCDVTDEGPPQTLTATLHWRDATSVNAGVFQTLAMSGDSSGHFFATLGPRANLAIVEFYVSVSDGVNTRTWPAPASTGQNANCQYQVTNENLSAIDSYYWLIMTAAENGNYNATASSNPQSDRQFNTTLIVTTGSDTSIRYRSSIRIRGNSSRSYQFKPLRVAIPNDDIWDGLTNFNLNPKASYLQFMGMRLLQAAGVRAPDSIPVKPRRNGVEYTTSSGSTPDFGRWVREEDLNGDLITAHWPTADGGGVYKKGRPDQYWRNTGWTVPTNPDGNIDGWLKQNNSAANDWTDLTSFFAKAQSVAAPHFPGAPANNIANSGGASTTGNGNWNNTAFTAAEITQFETVADLDQWARWFAVMTIFQDFETNISNGQDDDYAFYFAPNALSQRRANLLTHDMDTIFGFGDLTGAYNSRGLYDMCETGSVFRPLLPLFGTSTVAGNAAFRLKYLNALRDLFGTVFNADIAANPNPPFYQFVDSHLAGWVSAGTITAIKDFVRQRRTYLLGLMGGGATTPPAATSTATVISVPGTLMIHEVLANNVTAYTNGTSHPDVIELYNAGGTAIDLAGMGLTDDSAVKAKYVFPSGTTIAGGGFLLVHADSDFAAPGLHTGFGLDTEGDRVELYDTFANGRALLDSVIFGLQAPDFSIGRTGVARDTWALCTPTIGAANSAVPALAAPGALKINEWAGNSDYLLDDDFLEIFNPAAQPVAIGGMTITDDFINYPAQFALPPLSFIAPGGLALFHAKGDTATAGNATELPFKINANAGWLAILGQNGTIVDRVDVVAQAQDISRGRTSNGAATITTFGLPTSLPTPGATNAAPPANVLALCNSLRISELFYRPSNLEFIELHNIGAGTLDLAGVRFVNGVSYTFPASTTLGAGAYLVLCKDRTAFQARYGTAVPLAPGTFDGSLDNDGETIALQPPAPWDVNILKFAYSAGWFPETDNNYTLTVINDATTAARAWGEKGTWAPSPVLYGSPGTQSPPLITSGVTANGVQGDLFSYQIVAANSPTSYNATGLPDGVTVNTDNGLISGTPTVTGTFNITLSATNSGGTGTKALTLTIGTTGPVASLVWSAIPTAQQVGLPFAATLTAKDAQSRTVTSFSGSATITATAQTESVPVTPTTAAFANGVWSGNFTISAEASGVRVTANDGAGHVAQSNAFDAIRPAAPVITSPASAVAVIGGAFSFQIVTMNVPTSYTASGLPENLTLNTATGLIFGSSAAAGTFEITLSATNAGGTGSGSLTIVVESDDDQDGMGDAWEAAHGLDPGANDGGGDLDGDGLNNFLEWLAGTAPDDPASRLRITAEQSTGGNLTLMWTSVAGRRYRVFARLTLDSGAWTEITTTPVVATGASASFTHSGGAMAGQRFYRVSIAP